MRCERAGEEHTRVNISKRRRTCAHKRSDCSLVQTVVARMNATGSPVARLCLPQSSPQRTSYQPKPREVRTASRRAAESRCRSRHRAAAGSTAVELHDCERVDVAEGFTDDGLDPCRTSCPRSGQRRLLSEPVPTLHLADRRVFAFTASRVTTRLGTASVSPAHSRQRFATLWWVNKDNDPVSLVSTELPGLAEISVAFALVGQ